MKVNTVQEYLDAVPKDKKTSFTKLRHVIIDNLPPGFREEINYGMIGYVVPHELYPPGYHCNPALPLPFINLACQKNFIGFYHMGIYSDKTLLDWFTQQYAKRVEGKLDMGKSCIRFKKLNRIPFDLIGELVQKVSAEQWITAYEKHLKR